MKKMKKFMLTLFFSEKRKTKHYAQSAKMHDFLSESILTFEKWTKKMSKNEKLKYFCAKSHAFHTLLRI